VVIVISQNQMNVFAEDATSELADLIKSSKREVTQVKQDVVLANHAVDVVHQNAVHMV
jgi:hypothetical protein